MKTKSKARSAAKPTIKGTHAILGLDIVGYSTFSEEDQFQAVHNLLAWVKQSLDFRDIDAQDCAWSHAGDGGYVSFGSLQACSRAIDIAFDIVRRAKSSDWNLSDGSPLRLRMALHAGFIQETSALKIGKGREVCGAGINMTARILSLSTTWQLLVSRQYFDAYLKGKREKHYQCGALHSRSVKHGVEMEVMNIDCNNLCLSQAEATACQWQTISDLWERVAKEYELLIRDSLRSGATLAAVAAGKYLLNMGKAAPVEKLCRALSADSDHEFEFHFPRHDLLATLPPPSIKSVIKISNARLLRENEVVCQMGDPANTCFFVISGTVIIERPANKSTIIVRQGELIGEFSLWITDLRRTATIRSQSTSLIIEIPSADFRKILVEANAAEGVYSRIKRKIVDNVLSSPELFPGIDKESCSSLLACAKHPAGTDIDIQRTTYFLFDGDVEISPNGAKRIISARGQAGPDAVVGIVSPLGNLDGDVAHTKSETIAVTVSHVELLKIQKSNKDLGRAWHSLHGLRMGRIAASPD